MTAHRAINLALAVLIVLLLAYFGPHLDEATCLIGACGFIDLDETANEYTTKDLVIFWAMLLLMVICTLIVVLGFIGFLAHKLGWL